MTPAMNAADRLRRLEDEVEYLTAVVDGGEAQTREATVAVVGLLARFLVGRKAFDYDELVAFLAGCVDPDPGTEDHVGRLIDNLRKVVAFHRDDERGTLPPHVPAAEALGADEIARIRERSEAIAAFEREPAASHAPRRRKRRRVAAEGPVQ